MNKWLLTTVLATLALFASPALSQSAQCPSGQVCISQETANRLFNSVEQLIQAKDAINKMLVERGASDAALASALKTIEGWQSLDAVNNTIQIKQREVIALYEQTIKMYQTLVDNLEKRLNKPRTAWSRFVDILKNAAILLSGITLGRGI